MKIVISPAKSLDFESTLPTTQSTVSCFLKEANLINRQLKKQKPKQLMELMSISDKLADLNWQRNQER
ncbi:MAG: peroxide stress protein YaaA, partial [Flavobacterium sp.]